MRIRLPEVLRNLKFRTFYIGQSISALGGAMSPLAVTFALLAINGSAVDLGIVLGAGAVPSLLLTLFGGVAGDRYERRRILVLAECAMAICQALLAVAIIVGVAEIWHFVVVEFVLGCCRSFTGPAVVGFLPSLVRRTELQAANALVRMARNIAQVVGPAGTGVLVAVASPGWALAVDALSFVVSAVLLARLPAVGSVDVSMSVWRSLAAGWHEFRSRTWVWSMVGSFAVYQATVLPALLVLGPVITEESYAGATTWALVMSARAVGALAIGLVLLRWRPSRPLVASTAAILFDAPFFLALAAGMPAAVLVAAAVLSSAGLMAADILWESTLQAKVPEDTLSRVSSYDWAGSIVFSPVGYIMIGVVTAELGAVTILLVVTMIHILVRCALLAARPVRSVRW